MFMLPGYIKRDILGCYVFPAGVCFSSWFDILELPLVALIYAMLSWSMFIVPLVRVGGICCLYVCHAVSKYFEVG